MPRQSALKPRKNPRQRRAKATVEAILVAAAQVFEARGYAHGTTDRIAERAGVSVGSLYQYFPNKDAILVALAQRHMEQGLALAKAMLATAPQNPGDLEPWLRRLLQALLAMHHSQPRLQHMILEGLPLPQDLHDRMVASEAQLVTTVELTMLRLAAPTRLPRPRVSAWVLLHAIQGLIHDYAIHPPAGIDEDELTDELVALLQARLGLG